MKHDALISCLQAQIDRNGTDSKDLNREVIAALRDENKWCNTCGNQKLVIAPDATGWEDCPSCS